MSEPDSSPGDQTIDLDALEGRAVRDAQRLDGLHGDPSRAGGWIGHRDYARALVLLIPRLRAAESASRQTARPDPGWIPPSQRVPEPGPCTPMAHHWVSGSAVCQCGEATRDGDCRFWRVESRLTDAQICEAVTGQTTADGAAYRAFKDIDTAATVKDLEALMLSLAGKLGWADRDDAERRYYQRKAWLESQAVTP